MPNLRLTLFLLLQLIAACYVAASTLHHRGLTNADRLRRGLPLKAPVLRRGTATRRDSLPSNVPILTTYKGRVQVLDAETESPLGWIWPGGQVLDSLSEALVVEFSAYPGFTSDLILKCLSCSTPTNLGLLLDTRDTILAEVYEVGVETVKHMDRVFQLNPHVWSFDSSNNALGLYYVLDSGVTWSRMRMETDPSRPVGVVQPSGFVLDGIDIKLKLDPL
ncbi:hypothetical protein DL96DRAFT_1638229 [Flagelloscypha sp. PMI_526]|nr:hypothetical protein DL96DRAFT_1638229 [Flagelloscypha sp. PMI_526]